MKIAADAELLMHAYAGEGAIQRDSAEAIERVLAGDVLYVVASELERLVELVTSRRLFEHPAALPEVAALCNDYATAANVEVAETTADDLVAALALLREQDLGPERLPVALNAARLRRGGVGRVLTTDAGAYASFGFIEPVVVGR